LLNPEVSRRCIPYLGRFVLLLFTGLFVWGCGTAQQRMMVVTAYCGCQKCCEWHRGSWKYLKLDLWNRYVDSGAGEGERYTGLTASGSRPKEPDPGLLSWDSAAHPWKIPFRVALFPWLLLPEKGTIAADTRHYPFGTEMYVPGYGWGVVEDRGRAIKGPDRIDVFFRSHQEALEWGRRRLRVKIAR